MVSAVVESVVPPSTITLLMVSSRLTRTLSMCYFFGSLSLMTVAITWIILEIMKHVLSVTVVIPSAVLG